MKKQMKTKQKSILVLAVLMLMGAMLIGCDDRDSNDLPQGRELPTQCENTPPQPGGGPDDSNWVPPDYTPLPPRNPDGTLG